MTLTPAYGRDYKSKKDVEADWKAGKDFVIADFVHPDSGRYINLTDAKNAKIGSVNIRYAKPEELLKTCSSIVAILGYPCWPMATGSCA
jgi:hypothetical protein